MTVMRVHEVRVAVNSPARSLKMPQAMSLVSTSVVVSAARIEPEEKGRLNANVNQNNKQQAHQRFS